MSKSIQLPYNWKPRPYQERLWEYLADGGRMAVVVWHRRAGKDELCLHHTACAAMERVGNYWHMLPEYSQARKAIWDSVNPHSGKRRIDEAFPHELRKFTRENEMIIGFENGSTWQVVGSDNYNSLMGTAPAGMVLSEYALANPSAWGYLSPILMENNGWALFISTPRGKNHFYDLLQSAKGDPEWFCQVLSNDDTGVFTEKQMQGELNRLVKMHGESYGKSIWLHEYYSSFDAAIAGSIWGDCVKAADDDGRIGRCDIEDGFPVNTAWDLGRTDDTAIWWYQIVSGEIRVIDFFSKSGGDIPGFAQVLRDKKKERRFEYGTHWLPHDARPRTLAAGGKSILQQLNAEDVGKCAIVKRLDVQEGIQAARATFPFCRFDAERCASGLDALRNYQRVWDDEKKIFASEPLHDWSSHAADAWRYLSLSWKIPSIRPDYSPKEALLMIGRASGNMTYDQLLAGHFENKRRERNQLFA